MTYNTPIPKWICPKWPAPSQVHACVTTRHGGYSQIPYHELNLADHVGDDPTIVEANRTLLRQTLNLPSEPIWLRQVHSTQVVEAGDKNRGCSADAVYSRESGQVCAVLTADCLPLLFCDKAGTQVAATHAGWRGLAQGVLENTLQLFDKPPQDILVWLGPAIGPQAYEVGDEVREAFLNAAPSGRQSAISQAFVSTQPNHWLVDLYQLAKQRLAHQGVTAVYGGNHCTYTEQELFYSYRRNKVTGRMASLIWLSS